MRLGLVALAVCCLDSSAMAQNVSSAEGQSLAGILRVRVVVTAPAVLERSGLSMTAVQTEAEAALQAAGIRVKSAADTMAAETDGVLSIKVSVYPESPQPGAMVAVTVRTEFLQRVVVARLMRPFASVTWASRGTVGLLLTSQLGGVRGPLRTEVSEFVNAYLAANVRR